MGAARLFSFEGSTAEGNAAYLAGCVHHLILLSAPHNLPGLPDPEFIIKARLRCGEDPQHPGPRIERVW